ncbi:hypothetical protein [Limibacillus halophilus]|jgi:hypothetical protein
MTAHPSLVRRIALGKLVGLAVGLTAFFVLPQVAPEAGAMTRWGVLLWYVTLGGVVGMAGVMTWHPVLRLPLPWWFRAPMIGAWMNFVLTFFAYDKMKMVVVAFLQGDGPLASPWWFVLEGAIVGLLIGAVATRFAGEGPALVSELEPKP